MPNWERFEEVPDFRVYLKQVTALIEIRLENPGDTTAVIDLIKQLGHPVLDVREVLDEELTHIMVFMGSQSEQRVLTLRNMIARLGFGIRVRPRFLR